MEFLRSVHQIESLGLHGFPRTAGVVDSLYGLGSGGLRNLEYGPFSNLKEPDDETGMTLFQ